MISVKVTTVGNSAGVVLPKEALSRLKIKKGENSSYRNTLSISRTRI